MSLNLLVALAVGLVCLILYLGFHAMLIFYLKGPWRLLWRSLSLLPVPFFCLVLYVTADALQQESNLWPILMIFYVPAEAVFLGMLIAIYAGTRGKSDGADGIT